MSAMQIPRCCEQRMVYRAETDVARCLKCGRTVSRLEMLVAARTECPVTVTAEAMAEAQRRISALALQPLAPFKLKYQSDDHFEVRLGYYMGIGPTLKGTFYVPPAPVDPLDVEYDGVKLRDLLNVQRQHDQGGYRPVNRITPAQRAAVSAHWSAQLRAKVTASAAVDKARATSVVVDLEDW